MEGGGRGGRGEALILSCQLSFSHFTPLGSNPLLHLFLVLGEILVCILFVGNSNVTKSLWKPLTALKGAKSIWPKSHACYDSSQKRNQVRTSPKCWSCYRERAPPLPSFFSYPKTKEKGLLPKKAPSPTVSPRPVLDLGRRGISSWLRRTPGELSLLLGKNNTQFPFSKENKRGRRRRIGRCQCLLILPHLTALRFIWLSSTVVRRGGGKTFTQNTYPKIQNWAYKLVSFIPIYISLFL